MFTLQTFAKIGATCIARVKFNFTSFGNSLLLRSASVNGHLTIISKTNQQIQILHITSNMAPPSQLAIATSAVKRLVKEEASYHKELEQQQARIAKLGQGGDDENAEWTLKQEVSQSV